MGEAYRLSQDHYINGEPYEDFNKKEAGKGIWWDSVRDEKRAEAGDPAAFACDTQTFWVENGEAPNVENAVTPEILAQLAYARIKVPDTAVTLAPADATKVNLPTWAWLDKAEFDEVSVTASLDVGGVNIQATTTATPVSLKLEPGTPDAETYPASGECTINDDGSIGEPYAKGKADQNPPCGQVPPLLRRRCLQAPGHGHLGGRLDRQRRRGRRPARRDLRQRPRGRRPGNSVDQPLTRLGAGIHVVLEVLRRRCEGDGPHP